MAKLIITREDRLINLFRKYRIKANGKELITLANKETRELDLPEGTYEIEAAIDWTGSPAVSVTLNNNHPVTLEVGCSTQISGPQTTLGTLSLLLVIGLFWYYEQIPWQGWAVLIVLWFIRDIILSKGKSFIYYLTSGRHHYLYIRPVPPS